MRSLLLVLSLVSASAEAKPKNVAIVLYQGAEILDFAGPAEVFASASHFAGEAFDVYTVARTVEPIVAQGFIKITPQYSIDSAPRPDFVIIPGGGSEALSSDPAMQKWLVASAKASEITLTVCTGAFPLARAGLFDGLEITTFYGAIEDLRRIAPKARVTDGRRFIDNGRFVTTAGVSAGIDGSLHVIARVLGRRVADQTARYMEYHWTPEPYLAIHYAYWNPSTDDRGRAIQAATAAVEEKRMPEAIAAFRKLMAGDRDGLAAVTLGDLLARTNDAAGALDAYGRVPASASAKLRAKALYNAACLHARAGRSKQALGLVARAFALGFPRDFALADADLASIRADVDRLPR
jgi:transcriptional regulator GlxA family with amidase domain